MMRLWHQSFAQLDKLPAYRAGLEAHLKKVSAPGTEIVMHGMAPGTHTTMQPGKDVGYPYIQHLHSLQFLESVLQAENEGYDAYLLSTLPDPYLQVAQSLVDIPVVGFGSSSMHTASYLGRRFCASTAANDAALHRNEMSAQRRCRMRALDGDFRCDGATGRGHRLSGEAGAGHGAVPCRWRGRYRRS